MSESELREKIDYALFDIENNAISNPTLDTAPYVEARLYQIMELVNAYCAAQCAAARKETTRSWLNAYMQSTGIESDPFIEAMQIDLAPTLKPAPHDHNAPDGADGNRL